VVKGNQISSYPHKKSYKVKQLRHKIISESAFELALFLKLVRYKKVLIGCSYSVSPVSPQEAGLFFQMLRILFYFYHKIETNEQ
jgi:hypothetical protein